MSKRAGPRTEAPEAHRRWYPSLRGQLVALVVLFALVIGGGALYQRVSSVNDAVSKAQQSARFRAQLAARAVNNTVAAAEHRVEGLALVPKLGAVFRPNPPPCSLPFGSSWPFTTGYTAVIGTDGIVRCSPGNASPKPVYAQARWLQTGQAGPQIVGPITDAVSGSQVLVVTAPLPGRGVVASFLDLAGVGSRLSSRLSGNVRVHFALRAQGAAASPSRSGAAGLIRASVPVSTLGLTLQASTSRARAIAEPVELSDKLLRYLLLAFLIILLAVQALYLGMARPIRRLATTVRTSEPGLVAPGLTRSGPAEVVALGEALWQAQTAHVTAERERDAHAGMLNLIIQNSHALIYVKDLAGRYLLVNGAFEKLFGKTQAEMLGQTDELLDPAHAPVWRANDVMAQTGPYQIEEEADTVDGHRYLDSVKFPLVDASGTIYGTCGVSLDVTTQRNAITATAEARDAALAANAAKSAFLATMSHEIRTPMNAVIGMTDLLAQTTLDAQQREFVETVHSSGEALLAIINDILDFSKIESGELELEIAPFSLRDEVESCLDLVAGQAAAKGLDLLCFVGDSCPPRVVGDGLRLRQILINLLSNAVKFTERGEVFVEVECEDAHDGRLLVVLTVTDTGIGISDEGRERLFKSFSQLDASTTRLYGGTGLGLAISQRLAEAMGGHIDAGANPQGGSRFTVRVLLEKCRETTRRRGATDVFAPVLAGRSVLLVDDNATNLRILSLQLERLGMRCTPASSGEEALAVVKNGFEYDVAVLDMNMPDMTGFDLGRHLTDLPGRPSAAPLVLLTSLGWRSDGAEHVFTAILSKPVKSAHLRDTLTECLAGGRSVRAAVAQTPEPESEVAARRILLAEDNPVNQRVAQLMLRDLGHEVDVVANGAAAVKAVEQHDYDVVLMDVQMPVMDGLEATRQIRTGVPRGRQPHIVALTASALVEDREACADAGMEAYLTKPIRKGDLQAMLQHASLSGQV